MCSNISCSCDESEVKVIVPQPCPTLCDPWTVTLQASLSMGFSRQEYWNRLPFPPPGNLPDAGTEPESLMSPALASRFFATSATWEARFKQGSTVCGKETLVPDYE